MQRIVAGRSIAGRLAAKKMVAVRVQAPAGFHLKRFMSAPAGTDIDQDAILREVTQKQSRVAKDLVPWFIENMPVAYFRQVGETERIRHLTAMVALKDIQTAPGLSLREPHLTLQSSTGSEVAVIRPGGSGPDMLADILQAVSAEEVLARVKVYTALDSSVSISTFKFGQQEQFSGKTPAEQEALKRLQAYCQEIQQGNFKDNPEHPLPAPYFEPEAVKEFALRCNAEHILTGHPRRLAKQMALYRAVSGTEGVLVDVESWDGRTDQKTGPQSMITVASANVLTKGSLTKHVNHLSRYFGFSVVRAHLDTVQDPLNGSKGDVTLMRLLVTPTDPKADIDWDMVVRNARRLKWLDDRVMKMAHSHPDKIDLDRAEVIYALCGLAHNVLARKETYAYALQRMHMIVNHPNAFPVATRIADLFMKRFDPEGPMSDSAFEAACKKIHADIRKYVETSDAITVLDALLDGVKATLRTNMFIDTRYALALRVNPALLGHGTVGTDLPYGVFFVHGRRFNGFHVRFRDIARGGLRVVAPTNMEQHSLESSRQFNEAYSLAYAQQLKNKDIPEGGSKAVVLVEPNEQAQFRNDREFVIRKSVKAFCDAMLDLNTTHQDIRDLIVDYYGKEELIYLGPDENIIPSDIVWIIKRAGYRGYPIPTAFMSSKPDAGINHKVYGVTSEGVAVFADVALNAFGFKPKERPFTVKITGGPDGDVAGNMIKILARDYGSNAKILGISDGSGCGEDPDGLDLEELLRLFREGKPIAEYNKKGPKTVIAPANTPEGVRLRNTMHNRIKTDLFIPGGGRPATINESNYRDFIDENGQPSSKLVVEGANLFITPQARKLLHSEAGVVFVKDSSANKCGVICSSYEIIASMLLKTDEFMTIKEELVEDVLEKLRYLARVEAQLLFRVYLRDPSAHLPDWSERISRSITKIHDALVDAIDNFPEEKKEKLMDIVKEHLPHKLREVAYDRVSSRVPWPYTKAVIAAGLASKIVYREGIVYAEALPADNAAALALRYLEQEQRIKDLVEEIFSSNIKNKEEIADLLSRGGVRAGLETA